MPGDSEPPLRCSLKALFNSVFAMGGIWPPSKGWGDAVLCSIIGAETGVGRVVQVALVDADLGVVRSGIDELGV